MMKEKTTNWKTQCIRCGQSGDWKFGLSRRHLIWENPISLKRLSVKAIFCYRFSFTHHRHLFCLACSKSMATEVLREWI